MEEGVLHHKVENQNFSDWPITAKVTEIIIIIILDANLTNFLLN